MSALQDRIAKDGSLVSGSLTAAAGAAGPQDGRRPAYLPPTAPVMPPISEEQLQGLVDLVTGSRRLVVLTGAGCSTESAIPDCARAVQAFYLWVDMRRFIRGTDTGFSAPAGADRGPEGAYRTGFKPMTHQQFMASEAARRRYWARSFAGWHEFSAVEPNAAHAALARLQLRGWLGPLITQNVDRLHSKAGAVDVLELHGTTHAVICMSCGATSPRQPFQDQLASLNPGAAEAVRRLARAGHDAEGARRRSLRVGAGERDDGGSQVLLPLACSAAVGFMERVEAQCCDCRGSSGCSSGSRMATWRSRCGARMGTWSCRTRGAASWCRPAPAAAASSSRTSPSSATPSLRHAAAGARSGAEQWWKLLASLFFAT